MQNRYTLRPLYLLPALLALAFAIYWPGLRGGFLFDDFANLPSLGDTGPIDNWPAFWRYITSGTADPTGRPLTLLTFLLDAHSWPANPFPFKRTNVMLGVLNGALLFWLLQKLGRLLFPDVDRRRTDMAALFGAGFWLMHPLFVSTTLYIVQREAMLPATFTLLGLLSWLHGRAELQCGRTVAGIVWIGTGLGICTALAMLSKANGILLPALALVIEYVLLRTALNEHTRKQSSFYNKTMFLLAWVPTLAVACYLFHEGWNGLVHGISSARPWTLGQRMLTEPRVLLDYLDLLWFPQPFTPGLFNDHIQVSTSLWSPPTTVPALLGVVGLIFVAWKCRYRRPALAAALLFYFVGQSIESSTVPLELYFEHRNYLPAMLMFWPLALWLCNVGPVALSADRSVQVRPWSPDNAPSAPLHASTSTPENRSRKEWHKAKLMLAIVVLLGLGLMTHMNAQLWGDTHDQALLWAALNPDSPRAQANAAAAERIAGHPELAVVRLRRLLTKEPDQVQLALNLFSAECQTGQVDSSTIIASRTALRISRDTGNVLVHWFDGLMAQVARPPCPQVTLQTVAELLDAAQSNAYLAADTGRSQDLLYLQGHLALLRGDPNAALADFNQALDLQPRVSTALAQAALLGSMGFPRQGLAHLDHYEMVKHLAKPAAFGMPRLHAWVLEKQLYWPKELAHLSATLSGDATAQAPSKK
ncbi:MAG TPA: tetratricopeptide repeat protein [Dyella sp.]|uniref:tetratricopeptide repeat protein n=1 Tax=Dyella sp. TaxID=1869338 RepID=UPI002C95A14A|nr:tetratricopeptide repeat protein [Dyella sp.]HTV84493.1 tetratricopeptide repeat protein [Dyella sp.]